MRASDMMASDGPKGKVGGLGRNLPPVMGGAVREIVASAVQDSFKRVIQPVVLQQQEILKSQNQAAVLVNTVVQLLVERGILTEQGIQDRMLTVHGQMQIQEKAEEKDAESGKAPEAQAQEPLAAPDGSGEGRPGGVGVESAK